MEMRKFIKEELKEDQCGESINDYYDTLGTYSRFDSGKLYDVDIKSDGEFVKTKGMCQDSWKTASLYFPKLYIPLIRLEYSQNKEIIKYLKPLKTPVITSLTKLQFKEKITEVSSASRADCKFQQLLDLNLKMECVELETLNNNTLMQSPKHGGYALPGDFVSTQDTCDWNRPTENQTKIKLEDKSLLKKEILEKGATTKKYIQQTLNFGSIFAKRRKIHDAAIESIDKFTNSDISKATNKLRSKRSSSTDSDTLAHKSHHCNFCNRDLLSKADLTEHMLYKHKDGCSRDSGEQLICEKPHTRKPDLQRHLLSHDPKNWYKCEVCNKKFKMKNLLMQHMKSHGGKKYTCDICKRVYGHRSTLIRHMMIHIAGTEPRSYTRRPQKPETWLVLKKKSMKSNQDTINAPSKRYKCDVCGNRFEKKSSMKVHIEFLHVELFGDNPNQIDRQPSSSSLKKPHKPKIPSMKKRFRCRICNKSYTQLGHLRRHEASHLPNALQSNNCGLCEQRFSTTSSLSRHMLYVHDVHYTKRKKSNKNKKRPPKDFECKICSKAFRNLADLRRHCAIHDARKPYECDICKKQFALKGYLYAHILTHDNWKPYPCGSCSKLYRRKSSLQRHIDISHSDEKIHKCNICSKSFKFESTYRIHMVRFHPLSNPNV